MQSKPTTTKSIAPSSQTDSAEPELENLSERAVPKPVLGPKDKQDGKNAKARAQVQQKKGQIHINSEDPYSILVGSKSSDDQLQELTTSYVAFNNIIKNCSIQLVEKQKGEQFKNYYFKPKIPFLEEPANQQVYRKKLIKEVSRLPEPEPLYLLADKLHLECLQALGDRSDPTCMKDDLGRFYLRRTAQLQHKKYKLLIRWANSQMRAPELDNIHRVIDHQISLLQQEQDMCNNRLERLLPDDKYEGAHKAGRPSPSTKIQHQPSDAQDGITEQMPDKKKAAYKEEETKLYIERTEDRSINSAIRQDDFEVYLRQKTYQNKLNRLANKLINKVKWLPYLKRYDMWQECRESIYEYRQNASKQHTNLLHTVQNNIKQRIEKFGITDEKAIIAVTERYTFHIKEDAFISRMDQILSSHRTDIKEPYFLFASNIEMKNKIIELAIDYPTLSCNQLEIDNGQQFTYQIQTLFPIEFEKQIIQAQFEREDSGKDPDRQLLERLIKNLGLSRYEILQEISKYADQQRKNSIIGALGYNSQLRQDETEHIQNAAKANSHDQFSEDNLVRKIKTIEFFTLDELKLKLRSADWLEYICFSPNISEAQKQQNQLLSANDNSIDHLLKGAFDVIDVHDQVTINKTLEEASTAHIQKITAMQQKIIKGDLYNDKAISGREASTLGLKASLRAATNPNRVDKPTHESAISDVHRAKMKRFENIQNIDQLNLSLVKNYYSLRMLKSREYKHKLLCVVNYFRAVQRVLTLDLKEHVTREKALGERKDLIEPHFGKDSENIPLSKMAPQNGPGKIFAINLQRQLDSLEHDASINNPVTINCYKYNGLFNPRTLSTCPMLPKHHRTFGRPNLYESMSAEIDRKTKLLHATQEMECLIVKRDKIHIDEHKKLIKVFNEFGQSIIYEEALNDMVGLEEELIKIGSFFISQHEYLQANNDIQAAMGQEANKLDTEPNPRPSSLIDRPEIAMDLLKSELDYQFSKVRLIEKLLEAYEHIYDPLESVRCLQMIVDIMAQRPRLNIEASFYSDAYDSEIKVLQEKYRFFSDLIELQTDIEKEENKSQYDFMEMKCKRVAEAVTKTFKLVGEEKTQRVGSFEADGGILSDEQFALEQKIQKEILGNQAKKDALAEIRKKHITEYANQQYTHFAQVLGLPEISMMDLVNKKDQKEPIIQDAIREQAFFTKQMEGYPTYFIGEKYLGSTMGLHCGNVGLLDFYESLTIVPKIYACLHQAFEQTVDALKPENGLATSILELCLLKEARLKLLETIQIHNDGGIEATLKGQSLIEEDFYLANSDKLLFAMKEFKAEMDPVNLYKKANPLVVSKLDINSVKNYNFPRINMSDVRESLRFDLDLESKSGQENANDKIVKRMIHLARESAARQLMEKRDNIENQCDDDDDYENKSKIEDKVVRSPSMMRMACNVLEVVRIREELIQRISECSILTQIYQSQCKIADKNDDVMFNTSINFNTSNILKEQINIVDSNCGKNREFQLPFMEFDNGLNINLQLKSDSCIKALMTELGLEELRGILHYQIMQQQLLTVAIFTNQLLIDGPCKGLKELELLDKGITVPNPILKLAQIVSSTADGQNIVAMKTERQKLKLTISKISLDCMYFIQPRKSRDREVISKKFNKLQTRLVQSSDYQPEVVLRILRSYRLKLLHDFCSTVLQEVYLDSIKIQTLRTCNELRLKASLLPMSDDQLFTLGRGSVMENMSSYTFHQLYEQSLANNTTTSVKDILNGQIVDSSLFYIPHSEEIIMTDRVQIHALQERQQKWLDERESDVLSFDTQIKDMVLAPVLLGETFQPGITLAKESNKNRLTQVLPQNRVMDQIKQNDGRSITREEEIRLQMYKLETQSKQKYGFRKVNFQNSYDYGKKDIFRLLQYTSLILRIFTLEYLMGRNNTPGPQILEMEQKVLTGREFWNSMNRLKIQEDINTLRYGDHTDLIKQRLIDNETAADRVIDRILERKKCWTELGEEMRIIQKRVAKINQLAKDMPHERRTIFHINDMLILQHQASFYQFLNGIENILEIYRDKGQDEHFFKVLEVHDLAIRRQQGLILNLRNGFYVSQAGVSPGHITLNGSELSEFNQFIQQYHPVIDERSLIPKQVIMMQRVYGICSDLDTFSRSSLFETQNSNYSNLLNIFYNLEDRSRSFIGTNFSQLDELIKDFLIYKGLAEPEKKTPQNTERSGADSQRGAITRKSIHKGQNFSSEYLLSTVEILSLKIEAAHMQRILISWISGEGKLPSSTKTYTDIMRKYQDITTMKILQERDRLNELYFQESRTSDSEEKKQEPVEPSSTQIKRDRNIILNPETRKTAKFTYFDKVHLVQAETNVIKQLLDQKLIQIAIVMFKNEHSALSAAIDQSGSEEFVQEFVHPQQQFASTLLQDVDKLSHLDIVNKLGYVQQFLTRLRNRCTEVDTLTSGPGIVFSMKDFNDCISIFCKQALKYGEENLRQRTETSNIMANQYRHLIYLKEMEIVYYRSKCEQFLRNIDVIVNAKMSSKGNQMIYELDVTNCELRQLKDHYYLMERFLREEIRREFKSELSTKDDMITKLKADFEDHRTSLTGNLQLKCAEEIDKIEDKIKIALKGGIQTGPAKKEKVSKLKNESTPENFKIILRLQKFIREKKILTMMKDVIAEEKHQREIKEMELKLTLNASIWEQLAESQKREQIIRQELELTKRNLTHYEKLIERLYVQLEQLNNEKMRLQRYKQSKQKKISELESKMQDLEILENIDLDKILSEMRVRDKQIDRLKVVDNEFNNRMNGQANKFAQQAKELERRIAQERDAKNEAFAKLDSMRLEMKALEGTDIKNDLWKDKCKELYEISKELEIENDGLRAGLQRLTHERGELQLANDQLMKQRQTMTIGLIENDEFEGRQFNRGMSHVNGAQKQTQQIREKMILNRKTLVKPLTANDGQKRAQSGLPGAGRHGNRLYQKNMTNAQSYQYDRENIGASAENPMAHQTIFLSNKTSFPGFQSDIEVNSIGLKLGTGQRNLMIAAGPQTTGSTNAKYSSNQSFVGQRYSAAGGRPSKQTIPNLSVNPKKQLMAGSTQSSRAMGLTPGQAAGIVGFNTGVLSSNVIQGQTSLGKMD